METTNTYQGWANQATWRCANTICNESVTLLKALDIVRINRFRPTAVQELRSYCQGPLNGKILAFAPWASGNVDYEEIYDYLNEKVKGGA